MNYCEVGIATTGTAFALRHRAMTESRQTNPAAYVCQRCDNNAVFFRVRSEVIDIKVCVECGVKAASLGLIVTELSKEQAVTTAPSHPSDGHKESA